MGSNDTNTKIVCRFCLKYRKRMWLLETVYNKEKTFLEKIYQCAQINIIDLNELRTWVCSSCIRNIHKFYAFREMLQRNLADFNERFLKEQKEVQNQLDWYDDHLVEITFDDFSDCDDCYELAQTEIENDSFNSEGTYSENDQSSSGWLENRSNETNDISHLESDIKIEFTDTTIQETTACLIGFEKLSDCEETKYIKCEVCCHKFPSNATIDNEETIDNHTCSLANNNG